MKRILGGIVTFVLAVTGGAEPVAVCEATEPPDAGRQREFRVVAVDIAESKRRIAEAEADLESWKDRVAWTARMVKKCWPRVQLEADRQRLQSAEIALDRLRRELKTFPPGPKFKAK